MFLPQLGTYSKRFVRSCAPELEPILLGSACNRCPRVRCLINGSTFKSTFTFKPFTWGWRTERTLHSDRWILQTQVQETFRPRGTIDLATSWWRYRQQIDSPWRQVLALGNTRRGSPTYCKWSSWGPSVETCEGICCKLQRQRRPMGLLALESTLLWGNTLLNL